jgi:hypothetical protein
VDTSGNDFAIDDIEVRLCISPVLARINGKTNETTCFGDSIRLTVDPYTDDGILIVSNTDSLEGYWTKSSTGNLNEPNDWSIIPETHIKGAAGARTLIIPPFDDLSSGDGAVYYRFIIMKANTGSNLNINCRAISEVLSVSERRQITKYPDIRLQLCPDPARPIYLSSYLDSLYFKTIAWSKVSNGSPNFGNNSETGTGELRSEDFSLGTHIYQYNIVNECAGDSGKVYIKVLSKSVVGSLPDTVVVCRLIPSTAYLQLNQILGIEANGTWDIPADLKSFVAESSPPSHFAGAYVFDAQSAWVSLNTDPAYNIAYNNDVNSAAFKFTYSTGTYANPSARSCIGDTKHELVIIVTSKIFTL